MGLDGLVFNSRELKGILPVVGLGINGFIRIVPSRMALLRLE